MRVPTLVAMALCVLVPAAAASRAAEKPKLKKPLLNLRATPRMAFAPATVFLTAELQGGDDVEDYYCPELEWEWDDGGKSEHEGDCAPFEPGVSKLQRRFTAEHEYRRSGVYQVSVRLKKTKRTFAKADISVTIREGVNEPIR